MSTPQEPTLTVTDGYGNNKTKLNHPAFGVVTVTRPQSSPGTTLFGSDLQHQHFISVSIQTAEMERDLKRDWVFPTGGILEFSMSEAQWARFVAGAGRSQATPITLTRVKEDGRMVCVPDIKPPAENRKDAFNKEFQESLKQTLSQFEKAVAELADLSEQKSISKVKLREITSNLSGKLKNLPSNLNFAVESFREVSETVVEEAKAEIEAYIANAAHSAGIKAIQAGKTISPNPPELPPI